ncbi:MAG: caspase family protein [Deltaproteobacteria bacterium]|nr:caspase family protein [Deltaproteobacteria bacterium]
MRRFVWPFAVGAAVLATTVTSRALAEPVRILVSAGSKVGLAAERPLKFATSDASRVRDVVVSLGGVKPEHAFVLTEPSRAQLFSTIEKAKAEAQKHRADEVTLLFYFSGHGDREAIHLGDDRVLVSELSSKLGEVPAGLRIAVTDACRATRDKGFAADEPFAITATNMPQASGQVWLHASSDGEAAQESDELQGAIFTHAWLNGLRGAADANGDARVTLEESFAFAHSQTVIRSAKSSGVLQKPEAIVSLREMSPVVLTQTAARMATLSLPQGKDTHFVVFSAGAKSVLSELWSSPERRTTLRLPPGRYVIHRRNGAIGATAQIGIAEGETRNIEEREFAPSTLEALARKGGADGDGSAPVDPDKAEPTPLTDGNRNELSAGYDVGWNARTSFVHGPRAAYTFAWPRVAISVGGGADFTSRSLTEAEEKLVAGYGRASIEARVPVGQLVLRLGGGGRAGVLSQSISRADGSTATPGSLGATAAPPSSSTAFVFGPEIFVMARVGLDRRATVFVDLGATGNMLFLREEGSLTGIVGVLGGASLGARF